MNDGNVTGAGKKVLAIGGHTFIETMRVLDLAMIGGILRGTINATGITLEASATILDHEVADFVGRLMKRTDDLADSLLKRLFESSSLKGKFLIETKMLTMLPKFLKRGILMTLICKVSDGNHGVR